MRIFFISLIVLGFSHIAAFAQDPAKCDGLDMNDAAAIKACLESDEMWYAARTKPQFEPNQKCEFMQMQVLKISMSASDPKAAKRINSKTLDNTENDVPSCETLSEVVELIHGRPASWSPCMGYDEADDKFEHFKYCIVEYQRLRYNQPERKIGKMDCKRATATYQQALSYVYPARQDQGEYYGQKLPATYTAPDCAKADAFFNAAHEVELAEMEKRYQEEKALRAQAKAEREAKAKELAAAKKKARMAMAKYDEGYQDSLDAMSAQGLKNFKEQEHPKDSIDGKHIKRALVGEVWEMMPEKRYQSGSNIAKIIHTTSGFKSWTNNKMAPNVYHVIQKVEVQNCDLANGKARCTYDVTLGSNIDYHGMNNPDQRAVYNKLGDFAGGGARTITLESDFTHDGTQWIANLDYDQAKMLMPPEANYDQDQAAKDREKLHCDMMSTISGWPVC